MQVSHPTSTKWRSGRTIVRRRIRSSAMSKLRRSRLCSASGWPTGRWETILTGMVNCDPVRRTAWGTVLVGEESGADGNVLEIINPLTTTAVQFNHTSGALTGAAGTSRCAARSVACPSRESRSTRTASCTTATRTGPLRHAGRRLLQVHSHHSLGRAGRILNLSHSPLASGSRLRSAPRQAQRQHRLRPGVQYRPRYLDSDPSRRSSAEPASLRGVLNFKLTGYYRPEDLEVDRSCARGGGCASAATTPATKATDQLGRDHLRHRRAACRGAPPTPPRRKSNTSSSAPPELRDDGQHGVSARSR